MDTWRLKNPPATTTVTLATPAGTYAITVGSGGDNNYQLARVNGTLTLTPKDVPVIAWTAPAALIYRTALPASALKRDHGFVHGDDAGALSAPVQNSTAATGGRPGRYPIVISPASAPDDEVTTANGELLVQ